MISCIYGRGGRAFPCQDIQVTRLQGRRALTWTRSWSKSCLVIESSSLHDQSNRHHLADQKVNPNSKFPALWLPLSLHYFRSSWAPWLCFSVILVQVLFLEVTGSQDRILGTRMVCDWVIYGHEECILKTYCLMSYFSSCCPDDCQYRKIFSWTSGS